MSKRLQNFVNIKIETKKIDDFFSVYKDTQTFINEEKILYGICLNEEVENFKENLIFPEKGSQFMLLPKDALTNCDYLANQPISFLYQLAFPLECFFEDTDKCKHLKNFVFTKINEENNSFEIFQE